MGNNVMDTLERCSCSEQQLEKSFNPSRESTRENGQSPPHCTAGDCRVDIASRKDSSFYNNESYSAAAATSDLRKSASPAVPSLTFTLETPPKDSNAPIINVEVSPANSCHSSFGPMCRICHEGDSVEELISPCRCTGSLALVHKGCLERWLNTSHCDKCELCSFAFNIYRTPKPFWQFATCSNREARRSVIVDMTCFLILTPLAALSLYLCISSAIFYSKHSSVHAKKGPSLNKSEYWRAVLGQSIDLGDRNATLVRSTQVPQDENAIGWDIIGLVMLACLLIGIYLAWLIAAVIYHVKMWQHWRLVNQNVVLAETQRRRSCFSIVNRSYEQMEEEESPEIFRINVRSPVDLSYSPAARYLDWETRDILRLPIDAMENANTPAFSERYLSWSNLESPLSIVVPSLHPEELSDDVYDCVSLSDSIPKLNYSSISLDMSLLSPCVPRNDL